MISFSKDAAQKREDRKRCFSAVKQWATRRAHGRVAPELEPIITVQEIRCLDPDCPDTLETFVTVFWKGGGSWKGQLGNELCNVIEDDVEAAFQDLEVVSSTPERSSESSPYGKQTKAGPFKCPCCEFLPT